MDAYDLPTLFAHREVLEALDPDGPPRLAALRGSPTFGSIAILPGSFNPPTAAHLLLAELFARARLVVAPRTDDGRMVREILERPENRRWSSRVSILPLHPAVSDLSSTRVRGLLQAGADPTGLVPSAVGTFLADVGAFAQPIRTGAEEVDRYTVRSLLLDALWSAREWAERAADLR